MAEIVCPEFQQAIDLLKETYCSSDAPFILEKVCEAGDILNATYRPLLDGYYDGEYCKETYCNVRDFRDTALTFLDCAKATLEQSRVTKCDLSDIDDYIHEAVCWIEKAQTLLCGESFSSSCDSSCDSSRSDSCEDSCESSCESSCDETSLCDSSCFSSC